MTPSDDRRRTNLLAFVDGDHRFEGVFLDLYFMTRLVTPGALVVVDDMWMPAVRPRSPMAVLRLPKELPKPRWDEVVPPY